MDLEKQRKLKMEETDENIETPFLLNPFRYLTNIAKYRKFNQFPIFRQFSRYFLQTLVQRYNQPQGYLGNLDTQISYGTKTNSTPLEYTRVFGINFNGQIYRVNRAQLSVSVRIACARVQACIVGQVPGK